MVKKKTQDLETAPEDAGQPQAEPVAKRGTRRATSKEVQRMKSEKTRPRTAKPPAKTSKKRLQADGAETLLSMNSMERRRLLDKKLSPFDLGMEFAQKRHGQPPVRADQAFLQQILELRTQIRKYEEQQYKNLKYQSLMAGLNSQNPATLPTAYLAKAAAASTRPAPVQRKPAAVPAKLKPRSKTEPKINPQSQKPRKAKPAKKSAASENYVRIKPPTSGKKPLKKKKKLQRPQEDQPHPANGLKEIKEERDEIDENDLPRDSSRKGGFERSPYDEDVKIDEEERPEEPARVQVNEDSKKKTSSASPNPPKPHDDLIKVDVAEEKNRKEKERKDKADKEQRERDRLEKEKKDKEDRDRKEREKREKEEAAERERLERDKKEKEKAEREREREREKAERDRKENERLEKELQEKQKREKADREKLEREKQEKLAAEKKEKERMQMEENERREKQLAKEKADRERQEKEKEKEKAEREKASAQPKPSAHELFEAEVPRKNLIVDDNIVYDDDKDDEQFQDGEEEDNAEGNEEEELNEEMLRFYNEIPMLNEVTEQEVDRFKHKMVEHIYKYQILNAEEYQSLFQAAYYKNKDVIGQEEMAQIFEDLAAAIEQQGEEEGTEEGLYEEYPDNGFNGE